MASSCYFCCPAGKKLCSKLVINSLQKKCFCTHMCACMRVSVSKYNFNHWALHCVYHERAWAHYLIKIPFSSSIKTTWLLFAWGFLLPTLDVSVRVAVEKNFCHFVLMTKGLAVGEERGGNYLGRLTLVSWHNNYLGGIRFLGCIWPFNALSCQNIWNQKCSC